MHRGWSRRYGYWYRRGLWCPMHPWPPAWARRGWTSLDPYYPAPVDPRIELAMLEAMKKDLDESLRDLEARIKELKETITKEKTK